MQTGKSHGHQSFHLHFPKKRDLYCLRLLTWWAGMIMIRISITVTRSGISLLLLFLLLILFPPQALSSGLFARRTNTPYYLQHLASIDTRPGDP
jgi:hypothetical protein